MVSFAYPKQLPEVAGVVQSFVLDCGAFTVWRSGGGTVDADAYLAWVEEWGRHPAFDWCLIPDVIDGDERQNDDALWSFVRRCTLRPGSMVPVWHLHESIDRLRSLAGCYRTVALGSSGAYRDPGSSQWWARMNEAMEAVTIDGRPFTRLHGLRMLNPAIFTRLPFASADSTNATQNAGSVSRFGSYVPPDAAARADVIARRIEAHQSPAIWVAAEATTEALYA